jgi:hypothetical protein
MNDVEQAASQQGLTLIWLKHAALWFSGVVGEGLRDARDVDVLVASEQTPELQRTLLAMGYREASPRASEHHLPPLVSSSGACVEVHEQLWGVDLGSHADATADVLLELDLTRPSKGSPKVHVPQPSVLVAHALVHGLVQHFTSPAAYAPLRCLADLIDLQAWRFTPEVIVAFAPRHLSTEMVATAQRLSLAISQAEPLGDLDRPVAALLAHLVAASLDQHYRLALRALRLRELHQQGKLAEAALRFIGAHKPGAAQPTQGDAQAKNWSQRAREAWELSLGVCLLAYSHLRRR